MQTYVLSAVAIVGGLLWALRSFGLIPEPGHAAERYKTELDSAERELLKTQAKLKLAESETIALAKTRTLEPILELLKMQGEQQTQVLALLQQSSEAHAQVLDRLTSFNGTLKRTNESLTATKNGLRFATEGMKALTSTIAELHDIPMKENP